MARGKKSGEPRCAIEYYTLERVCGGTCGVMKVERSSKGGIRRLWYWSRETQDWKLDDSLMEYFVGDKMTFSEIDKDGADRLVERFRWEAT